MTAPLNTGINTQKPRETGLYLKELPIMKGGSPVDTLHTNKIKVKKGSFFGRVIHWLRCTPAGRVTTGIVKGILGVAAVAAAVFFLALTILTVIGAISFFAGLPVTTPLAVILIAGVIHGTLLAVETGTLWACTTIGVRLLQSSMEDFNKSAELARQEAQV